MTSELRPAKEVVRGIYGNPVITGASIIEADREAVRAPLLAENERLREAIHMAMLGLGSHGSCPACLNAHSILQNALAGDSHD